MTFDSYDSIFGKVAACVSRKFGIGEAAAEDFACRGLEYSLRYFVEKKIFDEVDEKDVFGLACWKASNLVKDGFRRHDVLSDARSLDMEAENGDGELAESPLMGRASLGKWHDEKTDKDWRGLGRRAYERLEEMFEELGLSPLRREVFRKVYLEGRPVAEVSSRLGITPNYAYGIVFGVKKGLAKVGPAILAAA